MQTLIAKSNLGFNGLSNDQVLTLNGHAAIRQCILDGGLQDSIFLKENILLFVIEGTYKFRYGSEQYEINKNQMAFLRKDIFLEYAGNAETDRSSNTKYITVSLKDELIVEFTKLTQLCIPSSETLAPITITSIAQQLLQYLDSLDHYFYETKKVEDNFIKIKLLELLFNLAHLNNDILIQLLDLRQHFRTDITSTVEENIMNSMSLNQLAILSGRSLSSFRRDFAAIYNMPPSQWIRKKRLEKARELLQSTTMTVTDVCYTLGFENLAHFSRLFKSSFGYCPSGIKTAMLVA